MAGSGRKNYTTLNEFFGNLKRPMRQKPTKIGPKPELLEKGNGREKLEPADSPLPSPPQYKSTSSMFKVFIYHLFRLCTYMYVNDTVNFHWFLLPGQIRVKIGLF